MYKNQREFAHAWDVLRGLLEERRAREADGLALRLAFAMDSCLFVAPYIILHPPRFGLSPRIVWNKHEGLRTLRDRGWLRRSRFLPPQQHLTAMLHARDGGFIWWTKKVGEMLEWDRHRPGEIGIPREEGLAVLRALMEDIEYLTGSTHPIDRVSLRKSHRLAMALRKTLSI